MSEIPVKIIICVFKIISRLFSNRKLGCHRIHDDNTEIHIEIKIQFLKIELLSMLSRYCFDVVDVNKTANSIEY